MSDHPATGDPTALLAAGELSGEDLKQCCSAAYAHPAVRWLLGGELHPGRRYQGLGARGVGAVSGPVRGGA
jgi:hypothetical protein